MDSTREDADTGGGGRRRARRRLYGNTMGGPWTIATKGSARSASSAVPKNAGWVRSIVPAMGFEWA
jgi:hypothetical protein